MNTLLIWLLGEASFGILASMPVRGDWTVADVVENVLASELLYDSYEVVYQKKCDCLEKNPPPIAARSSEVHGRTVLQPGLIYSQQTTRHVKLNGEEQVLDWLQGYDGEKTRTRQNIVGNIHLGKQEDPLSFRPHLILVDWPHGFDRLSKFLSAPEEDGKRIERHIEGEDRVNGLRCVRLRQEYWRRGEKSERALKVVVRLWLAIDRNYLPVRQESVRIWTQPLDVATAKPYGITTVEELREISPGVWFPIRAKKTVYDCEQLYVLDRLVTSDREETTVTKVDAKPSYDISFFRDIEFPPGTVVYTVRDNKIIGSEVIPMPTGAGVSKGLAWFAGISVVLVGLAGFLLLRWRRSSRA